VGRCCLRASVRPSVVCRRRVVVKEVIAVSGGAGGSYIEGQKCEQFEVVY
jgi:hypothetical protein